MYGRAVVWAVIGDCPTGVPIGGALSAAQTTPLFVTEKTDLEKLVDPTPGEHRSTKGEKDTDDGELRETQMEGKERSRDTAMTITSMTFQNFAKYRRRHFTMSIT